LIIGLLRLGGRTSFKARVLSVFETDLPAVSRAECGDEPAQALARDMGYAPTATLVRRDALLAMGLFDESLEAKEDFECFVRVLRHWPLAIVHEPLVAIRLISGSFSPRHDEDVFVLY
jgi:hypothetical protein